MKVDRSETHVTTRNQRFPLEAGTKIASVVVSIGLAEDTATDSPPRRAAVEFARDEAWELYVQAHGAVDASMEFIQETASHTTFQVLYEIRVRPN